jgi:Domain of unknown function (DUF397)
MSQRWRKSSHSGNQGECVELEGQLAAIRDSKNPVTVMSVDLRSFVQLVKSDRFTTPTN